MTDVTSASKVDQVGVNVQAIKSKLDAVWNDVTRDNARDFLKRAIGPETTVGELAQILSYDKVAAIKSELGMVAIGDVVNAPTLQLAMPTATNNNTGRRNRSLRRDIEREENEILAVVRENPGINRGNLARKVKSKLGNKTLSHVSYLLSRLGGDGKLTRQGERRNATYRVA